jgi:methylmalonyl-CoA/ethylmalonyl-CoA epimerase
MSSTKSPASLHHVGYVIDDIEQIIGGFAASIEADWDGQIIQDPLQGAFVAFLRSRTAGHPLVELVAPAGENSPVTKFLSNGGGLHHLCYEVDSLDAQLAAAKMLGSIVVRKPMPAVAFNGRRIAWVYTPYKLLIEYLER